MLEFAEFAPVNYGTVDYKVCKYARDGTDGGEKPRVNRNRGGWRDYKYDKGWAEPSRGESGGIASGVNPICATSGVTAFHSLALIRLHYAKMSQPVQRTGN